jgi:hypothetical protein
MLSHQIPLALVIEAEIRHAETPLPFDICARQSSGSRVLGAPMVMTPFPSVDANTSGERSTRKPIRLATVSQTASSGSRYVC